MSSVDSFFDVWTTLTFFVVFTRTLFVTFIAPQALIPGNMAASVYTEVCDTLGRNCIYVPVPLNVLYGGLINGINMMF